jgi:N-glycosylase/DNA lyase
MLLPLHQPLDLGTTLDSGQLFRWQRQGGWWSGFVGGHLVRLRGHPGGLEYRTTLRPERQASEGSDPESPAPQTAMGALLSRFFRLDDDLAAVHRSLSRDPRLAQAIAKAPGLRLLRQEPWECLVSFICSTNSNIPRIAGIVERLAQSFGRPVRLGKLERFTFPSPEALAETSEGQLHALGLGYRAPYVLETARAIAGGRLSLEGLVDQEYGAGKEALMGLPGVGPKVADCVLLFALEKLEAFPVDVWLRRVLEEEFSVERKLSYAKLAAWARERFGPWGGYAQQHLYYQSRWGGGKN